MRDGLSIDSPIFDHLRAAVAEAAKGEAHSRKVRHLEALIAHPATGDGERAAARNALARLQG